MPCGCCAIWRMASSILSAWFLTRIVSNFSLGNKLVCDLVVVLPSKGVDLDVTSVDVVVVVALMLEIGVGVETLTDFVILVELLVVETWWLNLLDCSGLLRFVLLSPLSF